MEVNKLLYGYFLGIFNYENNLAEIYNNSSLSKKNDYQGFLIKLSDYDNFKKIISYDNLLKENCYNVKFSKEDFNNLIKKYELSISNIKKVEQVNIVKPEDLIKLIKEGNKYKIIDKNLCELFCFKDKFYSFSYTYELNSNNLKFFDIPFFHHNNILDEFSYEMLNGNKDFLNLSKSIIEYFNFENKFIHNIPFRLNQNNKFHDNDEIQPKMNTFNKSKNNLKERGFSHDKHKKRMQYLEINII